MLPRLIVLGLFLGLILPIEEGRALPDPSSLRFCRNLQQGREELPTLNRWTLLKDTIRLLLAPGRLVALQEHRVPPPEPPASAPTTVPSGPPENPPASRRQVIFNFEPPEDLRLQDDTPEMREAYRSETRELRTLSTEALRFLHLATPEECAAEVESRGFDHVRLMSLLEGRGRFRGLEQITEAAASTRSIQRALRRAALAWEVIPVTDLDEVRKLLRGGSVEDAILIGHGMSDGRILDSRNNFYPRSFFEDLSPALRSLAVFSCYSEEAGRHYRLKESLALGTPGSRRRAVYLSPGSRLGGGNERVPVRAFPSFLRRLERRLARISSGSSSADPPPAPSDPDCRLRIPGLSVSEGTFGFLLNGHFVGAIHENQTDPAYSWPCRWLRSGRNILEMRSLGAFTSARARTLEFTVELSGFSGDGSAAWEHFFRPDGSHQGSKAVFTAPGGAQTTRP